LGSGSAGGRGSRNANNGAGRSSQSRQGKNRRGHRRSGGWTSRLRAGVVRGANRAADAAERPTEEGGASTWVVLNAGPTMTTARARGSTPGRRRCRMLPSSDEFHHLGSAFVCYPPRTSFTIWDRRSFGREEEDEEYDGDGSREKNNDKGTMTTTNDCSGRGRRNAEGRCNRNIIVIGRRWRWHGRTSRRLPPRLVVADIIQGRRDAARKRHRLAAMSTPTMTAVRMKTGGSE
jgi:hypothetical protein